MDSLLSEPVLAAAGKKVLLVGDLMLDRYIYGDTERISPEAPVPVLRAIERRDAAGGSASVAACLRALGIDVRLSGVVGDDRHGKRLRSLLDEMGADCSGVIVSESRPTTAKTRLIGLAQHRHRQQLLRLDDESIEPLAPADAGAVIDYATRAVAQVDAVCIEDYEKGLVTAELVAAVIDAAGERDVPVLIDPGRLTDYSRYRGATLLTPNRNELALAVGRLSNEIPEIAVAASELRLQLDVGALVVTLDREGALLVSADSTWSHIPTRPRSVYDNTGAGDAVLAMLAAAIAGGASLVDAVRLANIAGGLEVERFGCVPIGTEDVLAELRLTQQLRNGKLRSIEELTSELNIRRDRGETVAMTNGCFDILHAGHVDYLQRCREEASLLVVAINTDASVRSLNKGPDRPVNSQQDRARVLAALSAVDYVVLFDQPTPQRVIERIRPDVLIKGQDWADKGVIGREFVESYGGTVKLLPLLEGYATTSILERIRRNPIPTATP